MARKHDRRWFAAVCDRLTHEDDSKAIREEIARGAIGRILEIGPRAALTFRYYGPNAERVYVLSKLITLGHDSAGPRKAELSGGLEHPPGLREGLRASFRVLSSRPSYRQLAD